jgi:hypothetical protein
LGLEGFELREIPLSPLKLWELVEKHKAANKSGD